MKGNKYFCVCWIVRGIFQGGCERPFLAKAFVKFEFKHGTLHPPFKFSSLYQNAIKFFIVLIAFYVYGYVFMLSMLFILSSCGLFRFLLALSSYKREQGKGALKSTS